MNNLELWFYITGTLLLFVFMPALAWVDAATLSSFRKPLITFEMCFLAVVFALAVASNVIWGVWITAIWFGLLVLAYYISLK